MSTLPSDNAEKLTFTIEFLTITSSLISIFESSVPISNPEDSRLKQLQECYTFFSTWQEEAKNSPGTAMEKKSYDIVR